MVEEYPSAAFVLSLIGGVIILVGAMFIAAFLSFAASLLLGFAIVTLPLGILCGVMIIVGAAMMKNREKVYTGAALVLAFSLISLFSLGGFFLGFLLALIGGILGLTWRPAPPRILPPPPPV